MKKIYLVGAMCAYLFAGCAGNASQAGHDEHNHELEAHDHEHEGEDHDHDHEGHEHEGHDHEHEAGGTHPGEIVFKKALAEAVGLQTVTVNPAPFTDVIKTSGRVMAAQGEESVIVATVPGVISFGSLPFVDGTAVRKGQAVLSIASNALSDGDVAARAKFAYETAKKEYERMQALVGDKIVSAKDFEQARLNYENAKVAYEAIAGKQTAKGVSVVSPLNGYLKNIADRCSGLAGRHPFRPASSILGAGQAGWPALSAGTRKTNRRRTCHERKTVPSPIQSNGNHREAGADGKPGCSL